MRKTANYQLNQWDPEDRILREEFNGDNERIDAALAKLAAAAAANPITKLVDVTTQMDTYDLQLEVSQIDFTQYRKIEFYLETTMSNVDINLRLNALGESGDYVRGDLGPGGVCSTSSVLTGWSARLPQMQTAYLEFFPPNSGALVGCIQAYIYKNGGSNLHNALVSRAESVTWDTLRSIDLSTSLSKLKAGSRITLWGVRK